MDLILGKIFKKVFFSKKSTKNFRPPKFVSRKKNVLLKIFEISVEK
jgi:hypothetical protein